MSYSGFRNADLIIWARYIHAHVLIGNTSNTQQHLLPPPELWFLTTKWQIWHISVPNLTSLLPCICKRQRQVRRALEKIRSPSPTAHASVNQGRWKKACEPREKQERRREKKEKEAAGAVLTAGATGSRLHQYPAAKKNQKIRDGVRRGEARQRNIQRKGFLFSLFIMRNNLSFYVFLFYVCIRASHVASVARKRLFFTETTKRKG